MMLSALIVAFAPAPEAWLGPGDPALAPRGLDAWLARCAELLPIGPRVHRPLALAQLLTVGLGAAAARLAYQLFRGPGRVAAAVVAGPVTTLASLRWVARSSTSLAAGAEVGDLVFAILLVLGLGAHLRTVVHAGRTTAVGTSRALAGLLVATVLRPLAGATALGLLLASGLAWRERARSLEDEARPRAGWITAVVPAAALMIAVGPGPLWPPGLDPSALRWGANDPGTALRGLIEALPALLLFPALALPLVMVAPLRWRGGPTICVLLAAGLLIAPAGRSLLPVPVLIAALAIGAAGWIWLAGSIATHRPRLAHAASTAAAAVVAVLAALPGRSEPGRRLAHRRPGESPASITERGLVIPGDVLILHDPRVLEPLRRLQAQEGARPDVLLVDGPSMSTGDLQLASLEWVSAGRRVLSDSFDLGGRWPANWAIEAGPVYWFLFDIPEKRSWFDPRVDAERLAARDRDWVRDAARERARHRRAVGEPLKAASALPLPSSERGAIATSLELAELSGVPAQETQLDGAALGLPPSSDAEAAVLGEAADLLFAFGDERLARELVDRSLRRGDERALVALGRWLGRGGREEGLERLLERTEPGRGVAIALLDWLAAHDREAAALTVRRHLDGTDAGDTPADEAAARLRLLGAQAR